MQGIVGYLTADLSKMQLETIKHFFLRKRQSVFPQQWKRGRGGERESQAGSTRSEAQYHDPGSMT